MTLDTTSKGCTTSWSVTNPAKDAYFSFPALPSDMSYFDASGVMTVKLTGVATAAAGFTVQPLDRNAANTLDTTVELAKVAASYNVTGVSGDVTLTFTSTATQRQNIDNGYLSILVFGMGFDPTMNAADVIGTLKVSRYSSGSSNSFVAVFDSNNGMGTTSAQGSSATASLTANTFTKSGYAFAGWNTSPDGSGIPFSDGDSYAFTSDIYLYAQWVLDTSSSSTPRPTTPSTNNGNAAGTELTAETLASTGKNESSISSVAGVSAVLLMALGIVMITARRLQKQ